MFDTFALTGFLGAIILILGIASALHALGTVRTSQGTIAWVIALLSIPIIAVPLYWVFGRTLFFGYRDAIREALRTHMSLAQRIRENLARYRSSADEILTEADIFDRLTPNHFTSQNRVRLLIDGGETFGEMFRAIHEAEDYVLVQFYIVRDDDLGRDLQRRLMDKARAGVAVFFLYDEIGCHALSRSYLSELREAGVNVAPFNTRRGRANRFQINFRNHRKILVVDGRIAFVGGLNVGVEYMGRHPRIGPWRDTHMSLEGPAVQSIQATFTGDWYWATRAFPPDLTWEPLLPAGGKAHVLPFPTGPTDIEESCTLFFLHAAGIARERLWIASPYFVPDETIINALALAVLRGVDVRILIAGKPDHLWVYLAAFSFFDQMRDFGVKVYRYNRGFLHQKILLVDDTLASVGTANLDNRSLRLNFELNVLVQEPGFVKEVADMLEEDLANSTQVRGNELEMRGIVFNLGVRIAHLLAPVL